MVLVLYVLPNIYLKATVDYSIHIPGKDTRMLWIQQVASAL